MERVQYLLDKRIIREVTPIFDTRALGYSSMLVAAKVDAEHPHRAAQFINSHPGVTHNYLRNHDFNLWFTLAVEPDSRSGLDGTLDVMAAKTGAESIRQLPTLKLFKIRMDLEMEGGTDALKTAGEAVEPMELDPIELSDEDIDVIRATQGPMAVRSDAYVPAAEKLGVPVERSPAPARVPARARRPAPRGRDPLPPPRRLLRQRHGRVGGAGRRDPGHRPPDGRVSAASATATSARPTRTGRTRSSRWPTAARRRSATRCWTRSPSRPASSSARRCTRAPSSRRSGCSISPTTSSAGKRSTVLSTYAPSQTRAPRSSTGARCTCCRAA